MSSKRKGLERASAFGGDSLEDAAAEIFKTGTVDGPALVTDRIVARPISIYEILPDPAQPRRVVPSKVRAAGKGDIPALFEAWFQAVADERGATAMPFEIETLCRAIVAGEEVERPEKTEFVETALLKVVDLAASIRRDGLTNAITVSYADNLYIIETGERRWLAFHLLAILYSHEATFKKIPAKTVEGIDVWKQATENNQRDDLNAVGKARQYAILLMDLIRREEPQKAAFLQPFSAFEHEREYYAQAAHLRVPHGRGGDLANAMGLKNRSNLSQYRSLLTLPNAVWVQADDEGWPRDMLLQIVSAGNNSADQNVSAAHNSEDEPHPQPLPDNQGGESEAPAVSQAAAGLGNPDPPAPTGDVPAGVTRLSEYYDKVPGPVPARGESVSQPAKPKGDDLHKTVQWRIGDAVETEHGAGTIKQMVNGDLVVQIGKSLKYFKPGMVWKPGTRPAAPAAPEPAKPKFEPGDTVKTTNGTEGIVIATSGRLVTVKTDSRTMNKYADDLTLVKKANPSPDPSPKFREGNVVQVNGQRVDTRTGEIIEDVPPANAAAWDADAVMDAVSRLILDEQYDEAAVDLATLQQFIWARKAVAGIPDDYATDAVRVIVEAETWANGGEMQPGLLVEVERLRDWLNEILPGVKEETNYPAEEDQI